MIRAAVIGWPIQHSRSPLIHGYWLKRYGIVGAYEKVAVAPDEVEPFLKNLRANGYVGCNVTVPHKEAAFALSHYREPSSVAVGAANTVWMINDTLACSNTDTYGFMANLQSSAPGWRPNNGPALVLGAGGSARAVVHGLLEAGVEEVRVVNRTVARAEEFVSFFAKGVTAHDWEKRNQLAADDCALIVNTTTLGMNGNGDPGMTFAGVRDDCIVCDLVYVPLVTSFLSAAKSHGLKTVSGLGMLLHQAVPGFEIWFGKRPEVTEELVALVEADIRGT